MFTMKIKKYKKIFTQTLTFILVAVVFLSAAHARDIASQSHKKLKVVDAQTVHYETPMSKSLGELHSHVNKAMVKDPGLSKTKLASGLSVLSRREEKDFENNQSLSIRLIELMLMARLAYAYSFANS